IVNSATADTVSLGTTSAHAIEAADDGAACLELGGSNSIVGLAVDANTLVPGKVAGDYTPIATQLFPIAAQSGRFRLSNGSSLCATVPAGQLGDHAILRQSSC